MSWLQTQQLPRHPGSRHPTRKTLRALQMPADQPFGFPGIVPSQTSAGVEESACSPHTVAKACGVWKEGITFLHSPIHKTRDCNWVYSFHYWDHRRNYSLGPRPGTLTIQEPLDSGQGQSYQLGLLRTCAFYSGGGQSSHPWLLPWRKTSSQVTCHPPSLPSFCILGLKLGWLQPTLLSYTHCWKQG